jgi:GTP-binding protein Era
VGRAARLEMEKMFGRKIFLQLWVKVREGWSDDLRALRSLGYAEDN